jgi:hypothetical protein
MVINEQKTGWADHKLLRCLSSWSDSFKTSGTIKFFSGDANYVSEICMQDGNLVWTIFPHTPEILPHVEKNEEDLKKIFADSRKEGAGDTVLVYLKDGVRAITTGDFKNYYPESPIKDELFIFAGTKFEDGGFPNVYYYSTQHRQQRPEILSIFCDSSTSIMSCISSPTALGKKLVYSLLLSKRNKEVSFPDLQVNTLNFPTTGLNDVATSNSSTEFDKFVDSCPNNLTVGTGGMSYNELPVDESDDNVDELYGKPPSEQLEHIIEQSALVMGEVNLSDIFEVGIGRVIALLPITYEIINVVQDMSGVAKKMCIYNGLVHLIPTDEGFDPEVTFGEPDEFFNICIDENSYPKKVATKPYIN